MSGTREIPKVDSVAAGWRHARRPRSQRERVLSPEEQAHLNRNAVLKLMAGSLVDDPQLLQHLKPGIELGMRAISLEGEILPPASAHLNDNGLSNKLRLWRPLEEGDVFTSHFEQGQFYIVSGQFFLDQQNRVTIVASNSVGVRTYFRAGTVTGHAAEYLGERQGLPFAAILEYQAPAWGTSQQDVHDVLLAPELLSPVTNERITPEILKRTPDGTKVGMMYTVSRVDDQYVLIDPQGEITDLSNLVDYYADGRPMQEGDWVNGTGEVRSVRRGLVRRTKEVSAPEMFYRSGSQREGWSENNVIRDYLGEYTNMLERWEAEGHPSDPHEYQVARSYFAFLRAQAYTLPYPEQRDALEFLESTVSAFPEQQQQPFFSDEKRGLVEQFAVSTGIHLEAYTEGDILWIASRISGGKLGTPDDLSIIEELLPQHFGNDRDAGASRGAERASIEPGDALVDNVYAIGNSLMKLEASEADILALQAAVKQLPQFTGQRVAGAIVDVLSFAYVSNDLRTPIYDALFRTSVKALMSFAGNYHDNISLMLPYRKRLEWLLGQLKLSESYPLETDNLNSFISLLRLRDFGASGGSVDEHDSGQVGASVDAPVGGDPVGAALLERVLSGLRKM